MNNSNLINNSDMRREGKVILSVVYVYELLYVHDNNPPILHYCHYQYPLHLYEVYYIYSKPIGGQTNVDITCRLYSAI